MSTNFDYIIVGQGLCGTLLSRCLLQAGKRVLVIDEPKPLSASKVASGVINPVTGRRIVRTWRMEELLPFAWHEYNKMSDELGVPLVSQLNIVDFHATRQMQEAFNARLPEETSYLRHCGDEEQWQNFFRFNYGAGEILGCLLVDINAMLQGWRRVLANQQLLLEERFSWDNCTLSEDEVNYKNIAAEKIICCDGVEGFNDPYFKNLPYSRMKGEALIVSIPGLPRTHMYKQGINIVPWKDDLFWIGSSYEWDFKDLQPTPQWRKKVEEQLAYWLRLPFSVVDHLASERPANMERRPFVGLHPQHKNIGILNGMGAKGCSLAPFFARQLANNLLQGSPIYPDADVQRFQKVLNRKFN